MTQHPRVEIVKIVSALARNRQRATYAAVGGVGGLPVRSAVQGQSKTIENSRVVAKSNGLLTGYAVTERDPHLLHTDQVIRSSNELRTWLSSHS